MAIAIAATAIVLTLVIGFLLFLEIGKMEKQILEIQEQIHYLNNKVSKMRSHTYNKRKPKDPVKQVIKG
jgi:hypothetical protein